MGVLAHVFGHTAHEEAAEPSVGGVLLTLAGTVPLIWRRRHPVIVLVAVAIPQFWLELMNSEGPGWMAVLIACYSVGAHHSGGRTAWIGGVFSAVATAFV